jgi:hypothetical protein
MGTRGRSSAVRKTSVSPKYKNGDRVIHYDSGHKGTVVDIDKDGITLVRWDTGGMISYDQDDLLKDE